MLGITTLMVVQAIPIIQLTVQKIVASTSNKKQVNIYNQAPKEHNFIAETTVFTNLTHVLLQTIQRKPFFLWLVIFTSIRRRSALTTTSCDTREDLAGLTRAVSRQDYLNQWINRAKHHTINRSMRGKICRRKPSR